MANKKSTSKKNTTKKVVNTKKNEKIDHNRIIETVGEFDADYKKIILVVGIIVIVFCLFYFLTVYITGKDSKKTNTSTASNISYTEIMAGRSFNMPEEEYLVLYYDRSNSDLLSSFSSNVSNYRSSDDHYTLYTVDMSNAVNKSYSADVSNWSPASASELAISGPTLIHFRNGSVVEYYEGEEDINHYLG